MNNEPNANDLATALAVREFLAAHHHPTTLISNCTEEIATILAAHRAESESELAKVAKLVSWSQAGALNWVEENGRKWVLVSEELMTQLDAALAAHDAGKEKP